jgi:tripeptidyl-peptidase II
LQIYAPLRRTKIHPKATLNNLAIPLRPTDHVITPLTTSRDALPRGRVMHRMLLTYKLTLAEGGSITPRMQPLDSLVYDGALEGHLFGVFDANKKLLSFGDVYPKSVTVGKGTCPSPPPS